jgi:hypothetical protein
MIFLSLTTPREDVINDLQGSFVMSQHFLLSRPAKTLSLAQVFRMTDTEAEAMFRKVRWPETDGAPVCPHCGGLNAYVSTPEEKCIGFAEQKYISEAGKKGR